MGLSALVISLGFDIYCLDLGLTSLALEPLALTLVPMALALHQMPLLSFLKLVHDYLSVCVVLDHFDVCFRYAIVWKKGYQEYDDVLSSVSTKVKGIAVTNYTELNITHPDKLDFRIWDVADYVMPPQVFFNFINSP